MKSIENKFANIDYRFGQAKGGDRILWINEMLKLRNKLVSNWKNKNSSLSMNSEREICFTCDTDRLAIPELFYCITHYEIRS